jgi:hypothetical protein
MVNKKEQMKSSSVAVEETSEEQIKDSLLESELQAFFARSKQTQSFIQVGGRLCLSGAAAGEAVHPSQVQEQ